MPYTSVAIVGYNSNPPSDDGSTSSTNQLTWNSIKNKLGDPLKTAIEAIDSRVATAINVLEVGFFEAGTKMVYLQTAAPTNWTKLTDAAYNNAALRLTNSTAGTGGSLDFTSAFTARTFTLSQANLPACNFTHSLTAASHTHGAGTLVVPTHNNYAGSQDISASGGSTTVLRPYGSGSGNSQTVYSVQQSVTGNTAASGTIAVTGTVASGGSGTAVSLNFAVKYVDVILAQKNA